jgi:hypothetical protein
VRRFVSIELIEKLIKLNRKIAKGRNKIANLTSKPPKTAEVHPPPFITK